MGLVDPDCAVHLMKRFKKALSATFVSTILLLSFLIAPQSAQAVTSDIDIRSLQSCLKQDGSSLDVLVLMDSSRSLRDPNEEDKKETKDHSAVASPNWKGSDPQQIRGKILLSSLKLLRSLAQESKRDFQVNLRNFGDNRRYLESLREKWIPWTNNTSDQDLKKFVENALFDESSGTNWDEGLQTARSALQERIGQAQIGEGKKSCPIMFWITDGAADPNPEGQKRTICTPAGTSNLSLIEWFRANNVLVLGGLLRPRDDAERSRAEDFRRIVEGQGCGKNEISWTKGSVVEADDVSSLAWAFQKLVASIKNLIDLGASSSSFLVDPGTSKIEVYIRGPLPPNWQINASDGAIVCSDQQQNNQCQTAYDDEIGIATIFIKPAVPASTAGTWTITPSIQDEKLLVYGGIDVPPGAPYLSVTPGEEPIQIDEGKPQGFDIQILNPDGSAFNASGFSSIEICASVTSSSTPACKPGPKATNIEIRPSQTDKSVFIQATLISANSSNRKYLISKSLKIEVAPSGEYPSLVCQSGKDTCKLAELEHKNKSSKSVLKVVAAESSSSPGQIYLVDFSILKDSVEERGDGGFDFQLSRGDKPVSWNNPNESFMPGEEVNLSVSTKIKGKSDVVGVIKYVSRSGDKEIARQLKFTIEVNEKTPPWVWLLIIGTYLLTLGIPYLILLAAAKRRAFLEVPDNELSFVKVPFKISKLGKLVSPSGDGSDLTLTTPSHKDLGTIQVSDKPKSLEVESALIEISTPKWNPFVDPTTTVSIVGSHILTTCGESRFVPDKAVFSREVVDEAVIYFASEENLSPVTQTKLDDTESSRSSEMFASSYEAKISEELMKRTDEVIGSIIFIVPRMTNRRKALEELKSKILSVCESLRLNDLIDELREEWLDKRLEEQKKALEVNDNHLDGGKKTENKIIEEAPSDNRSETASIFDEPGEEKKSIWGDDSEFPDSERGRKLWD